jgi:hypothetical protein
MDTPEEQLAQLRHTHATPPTLDLREQHFRIAGPREGLSLFLRFLPAEHTTFEPRRSVLYVHGATFPSGLSIAYRLDGRLALSKTSRPMRPRSCRGSTSTSGGDAISTVTPTAAPGIRPA